MVHKHHRVLGNRADNRPVNILLVDDAVHRWIHDHPAEAMELGWIVSKFDDPEKVSVCIPKTLIEKPKREKKPRAQEKPRNRATISFKVPQDKREDGAGLFDDLFSDAKERLSKSSEGVNVEGATGNYGALIAVLWFFNTHFNP